MEIWAEIKSGILDKLDLRNFLCRLFVRWLIRLFTETSQKESIRYKKKILSMVSHSNTTLRNGTFLFFKILNGSKRQWKASLIQSFFRPNFHFHPNSILHFTQYNQYLYGRAVSSEIQPYSWKNYWLCLCHWVSKTRFTTCPLWES